MKLNDAVVVITGANSGLGKALALALKLENAKLVISSRIADEALVGVARETNGMPIAADITKEREVVALADAAVKAYGRIDVWINNAGIWIPHASLEELDFKRAHELIDVNLFGTMYGSREALLRMKKHGFGIIINILSTSALQGRAGSSAYCASKYTAKGFTKSLQLEVDGTGVQVIAVYPGGMMTHLFDENKPDDFEAFMDPADVANAIVSNIKQDKPLEEVIIRKS